MPLPDVLQILPPRHNGKPGDPRRIKARGTDNDIHIMMNPFLRLETGLGYLLHRARMDGRIRCHEGLQEALSRSGPAAAHGEILWYDGILQAGVSIQLSFHLFNGILDFSLY